MLQCYDNIRPSRLPNSLKDSNPSGIWRRVDGKWSTDSIG